jgi:hypothetical protein
MVRIKYFAGERDQPGEKRILCGSQEPVEIQSCPSPSLDIRSKAECLPQRRKGAK